MIFRQVTLQSRVKFSRWDFKAIVFSCLSIRFRDVDLFIDMGFGSSC
jgi:hypothetical protein